MQRVYTEKELQFLKDNYKILGPEACAKELNRSRHGVQAKASELGLRMWRTKPWTNDEIQFLIDNYAEHGALYCADKLGRGRCAVQKKAGTLGLKQGLYFTFSRDGYMYYVPSRGEIYAMHILVMEHHLGRKILPNEIVHHKDGDRSNNSIHNLELLTRAEHINIHREELNAGKLRVK